MSLVGFDASSGCCMKCRFFLTFYLRNLEQTGLDMIKAGTEFGWNIWFSNRMRVKVQLSLSVVLNGPDSAAMFFFEFSQPKLFLNLFDLLMVPQRCSQQEIRESQKQEKKYKTDPFFMVQPKKDTKFQRHFSFCPCPTCYVLNPTSDSSSGNRRAAPCRTAEKFVSQFPNLGPLNLPAEFRGWVML